MISNSYKSSPLIEENSKGQHSSIRSKRSSKQRDSNDFDNQKILNPFRSQGQDSYLPPGLLAEIGDLEYITPQKVQSIAWAQAVFVPRRSSVFTKHLQAMQRAARQQIQKSKPMINILHKGKVCFAQEIENQNPGYIEQNDACSLGMRHCLQLQQEAMDQQLLFLQDDQYQPPNVQYYSFHHFSDDMNDDCDDYFNS